MKVKEIAAFLSAELVGDPDVDITGIASIESAEPGHLSFSANPDIPQTSASALIVPYGPRDLGGIVFLKVQDPKFEFARAAKLLQPCKNPTGWHDTAILHKTADVRASFIGANVSIGENSYIGDGCSIHPGVRIGCDVIIDKDTTIHPNCVIYDGAKIGRDCVIQAGTVIGSDGFGYVKDGDGKHHQFPQAGSVVIEDSVDIGANCTIDRGSLGVTRIGEGTKIDNLVHIAHNVRIGKRVLIAGQSGIAGSSTIEDDVVIAGQVGISDHVLIRSGAIIGAKSVVFPNKVIGPGFWMGIPIQKVNKYLKQNALIRGLERLKLEVKKLRKDLDDAS